VKQLSTLLLFHNLSLMSYICMCDKGDMYKYHQCLRKITCPLSQFTRNHSCLSKKEKFKFHSI